VPGNSLSEHASEVSLCGQNERYAPPVVLFQDFAAADTASAAADGDQTYSPVASRSATLLFRVDETTSRSQFLAHYSFTKVDDPDSGLQMRGAVHVEPEEDEAESRGKAIHVVVAQAGMNRNATCLNTT